MRTRTIQLALAVTLLGAVIAYAADLEPPADGGPGHSRMQSERPATVKVRGHVRGLYPGARKRMMIRVSNHRPHPVWLRHVRTRVRNANPDCTGEYLHVRHFKRPSSPRYIGGHARTRVRVRVRLRPSAPDACQNAQWPLRFRARVRGPRG